MSTAIVRLFKYKAGLIIDLMGRFKRKKKLNTPPKNMCSSDNTKDPRLQNYKELYDFSIKALENQQQRFNNLSERGAKLLTVFTVLIASYGFLFQWGYKSMYSHQIKISEITLILMCIAMFVFLIRAWYYSLKSLKLLNFKPLTINLDMIKVFSGKDNNIKNIYYSIADMHRIVVYENETVIEDKVKWIKKAYESLVVFLILSVISTVHFVVLINLINYEQK